MGTVYRAIHVRLGREVALKVLPKGRNTDQRAVARFEREMAAVGKLDHPHIVRATDAGEVEGVQYLAMELIDGFDLTELVDYLGPLGVANSCEIIRQAALGLQCAYEQGLVHRDIKPSNVMVTGAGIAKILDLGLARFHIDKQSNIELTTAGQPMGTADYMAPEQVADTHSVDIRADIYSLGCTFYKILAGQPPFGGVQYSSSFDKMMAHRKDPPPPIQESRPDLPKKVVAVLDQMLAKDPDERFQKPSDLAETLYPLCAGANLPEMIESAWKAAATAPVPQSTAAITPDGDQEPSGTSPQRRAKRRVQTGSSTHSASRSQYSGLYVLPPPAKPQWGLWLTIGILSSLLVGILSAYVAKQIYSHELVVDGAPKVPGPAGPGWAVSLDKPAVPIPPAVALAGRAGKPPRVRGALGEEALVADPSEIAGVTSWTLETVGHRTPILCAAVEPNGATLATGSGEGAIRIWDLVGGSLKSILIYPGRDGEVRALAWAPGGTYLAAAYEAGTLLIWDVEHGTVLPDEFSTRSQEPGSLAWSPDGTRLAYVDKSPGQEDRDAVMLWDFKANKAMPPLIGATGKLRAVAFAPDGSKLAAGGSDLNIHVWDSAVGREPLLSISTGHIESISALAWSPCATMIASSCDGGWNYQGIAIWSLEDGSKLGDLPQHTGGDRSLVWLAQPSILIGTGGQRDGRTRYYDLASGIVDQDFATGRSLLCRVGATDKVILVQGNGDVLFCESTGLGRPKARLPLHPGTPSALAISPDSRTVACGSQDGSIRLVDVATGQSLQLDAPGPVHALVYSPDTDPEQSKLAVTTESWNETRQRMEFPTSVYDVKKRKFLWSFDERIEDLAWSPDGNRIATAGDSLSIWDGKTGNYRDRMEGQSHSVAWVRDGTAVALGSPSTVELVDAKEGNELLSFLSFTESTGSRRLLAWSAAAARLAIASGNAGAEEIVLLAAETGAAPSRVAVSSQTQPIIALGWQADGKAVLTASLSETCSWDIATGERTSKSPIGSQAFSADGKLALLGGPSSIRLHQPQDRKLLRTLLVFPDHKYAAISPEGHCDGSYQSGDIAYIVQTPNGQAMLDEQQFATQYGWKNDPGKLAPGQN